MSKDIIDKRGRRRNTTFAKVLRWLKAQVRKTKRVVKEKT